MIKTPLQNFYLRPAVRSDVAMILRFIRELAEYEKLAHEVVADETMLAEHLFGTKPKAEAVLGIYNDTPVAFALFFHNFSTFLGRPGIYLEDLYVTPAYRGKGVGKIMLGYLAKLAVERGCGRLEWWVLDWNEPAIRFYKGLGAEPMSDWTVFRLTGDPLNKLGKDFQ